MIRSFFIFLYIFIYCLLGIVLLPLLWLIKQISPKAADWIGFWGLHFSCKIGLIISGLKLDVKGLEYLPKKGPVVYIMNHRSIFDIIIAYAFFKTPTGFIAKNNLAKIPLFSSWLLMLRGLFMNRENVREGAQTILKGISYIKEGVSMAIFPEGTRNRDADLKTIHEFHGGSFKLAEKTGVPIVPIVFYNTAAIFETQKPWIKSTAVKMTICEPIQINDLSKEEKRFIGKYVHDIMQDVLNNY